MIELPAFVSVLDAALGIADADRIEASAKVLTVNPINKSRFMKPFPRVLLAFDNALATRIVPVMECEHIIRFCRVMPPMDLRRRCDLKRRRPPIEAASCSPGLGGHLGCARDDSGGAECLHQRHQIFSPHRIIGSRCGFTRNLRQERGVCRLRLKLLDTFVDVGHDVDPPCCTNF